MEFRCRKRGKVTYLVLAGIGAALVIAALIYMGMMPVSQYKYAFMLLVASAALFLIGGNKIVVNIKPKKVAVYYSPWVMSSFRREDIRAVSDEGGQVDVETADGKHYAVPVYCLDDEQRQQVIEVLNTPVTSEK